MKANSTSFPNCLSQFGETLALLEPATGRQWHYDQLALEIDSGARKLAGSQKKLIFLFGGNDAASVLSCLSVFAAGHALYFSSGTPHDPLVGILFNRYQPEIILWRGDHLPAHLSEYVRAGHFFGFSLFCVARDSPPIHPDLAILLATSGSLGMPKLVKLSLNSVVANSLQIIQALRISCSDRAVLNLPLNRLTGFSVLITHLMAGSSVICEKRSVLDPSFWDSFTSFGASTLPGVPFTYKLLKELRVDQLHLPTLRKITFAGGRLPTNVGIWLCEAFMPRGVELFSMYGQTEAGRISILTSDLAFEKLGSVGKPLLPTQVDITTTGELVCRGPGVMLGYAKSRDDLALGDETGGVVCTGDLGRADSDGFLYITGRLSRFCKILGERIDLAEVEAYFDKEANVAAISNDEHIVIFFEEESNALILALVDKLAQNLHIPRRQIIAERIAELPRSDTGKISYGLLKDGWSRFS